MAKLKLERGTLLEETKGSLDDALRQIRDAFRQLYPIPADNNLPRLWVAEIFTDYIIVETGELQMGEFYRVTYTRADGDVITFAARDQWEVVELVYQPQTPVAIQESHEIKVSNSGRMRLDESATLELIEASGADKKRRIKISNLIVAGTVNGNGRRYSRQVAESAIANLNAHLNESAGNGRLGVLTGEAEHPRDKGRKKPQWLDTVVRWDPAVFDGQSAHITGTLIPTIPHGQNAMLLMESGVMPGGSVRGYYNSKLIQEGGQEVEEVTACEITGIDLVGDPSFVNVAEFLESRQRQEKKSMEPKELKELIEKNPDLFKGLFEGKLEELGAAQLKALEETVRAKLGIGADADLGKALTEAVAAQKTLAEQARKALVESAITEETKELPYGKKMNATFVLAVRSAVEREHIADPAVIKPLVESKRREYDALAAEAKLAMMGHRGVPVLGSVLESETGTPEFARGAHEFTESLVRRGLQKRRDFRKPYNVNEQFTGEVLTLFDKQYQRQLLNEARQLAAERELTEAELSTDLSLPYSVARAVIAAAFPQLVAVSLFDYGVTDQAPTKIFFETYARETGVDGTVAMGEAITMTALDTWYNAAQKRLKRGTVVVKNVGETVTYVEGTDYVVDHANGRFKALTGGGITALDVIHVGYQYLAIRKGENATIERGKMTLASKTLEIAADRLATTITNEAMVFSRSQLGWDAVTRTLNALINDIRRKIDSDAFDLALNSAESVALNIGGTWTAASDPLNDLVSYLGEAKNLISYRYYTPTGYVLSERRSEQLGHWDGFTAAGKRPADDLTAEGYTGRLNGLPVFRSTEFTDTRGLCANRELVMHRIFQAMQIKGPFPTYSSDKLVAAEQYYAEEFNGTEAPVAEKGSYIIIV